MTSREIDDGLFLIRIETPATTIRTAARTQIRRALCEALAPLLNCAASMVPLVSETGRALRVDIAGKPIGLSVSHEPGLSVAAINLKGAVGIDLMRIDPHLEWQTVARDYLGSGACHRITGNMLTQQAHAFANEWVCYEASLKCHGFDLQEWSPGLECALLACSTRIVDVAHGLIAAIATLPAMVETDSPAQR